MRQLMYVICMCLLIVPAFCKSASNYQVGTITEVHPHNTTAADDPGAVSYDVTLKVGDTVYVVLYTSPSGVNTVKYAAGRDLLVLVGDKTIRYNDILGQSHDLPIVSRKPATDARKSK